MEAWAQKGGGLRRWIVRRLGVAASRVRRTLPQAALAARPGLRRIAGLAGFRALPAGAETLPDVANWSLRPLVRTFDRVGARLEAVRRDSSVPDGWQLEERGVAPTPPVGRWIAAGLIAFAIFFGGFGAWAALAPLSSASVASGTVKIDSNRKTIQHYEGGIIREILVRDGDHVREGQVLMRLDDVDARADYEALRGQRDALRAREVRLVAQRDQLDEIEFPDEIRERMGEIGVAMTVEGQQRIFEAQSRALRADIAVWRRRAETHRAQIAAHEAEKRALASQLATLEEELEAARKLLESGFERRPRVLELERRVNQADGQIAASESRIAALNEQIAEAALQVTALRERRAREVSEELREVQTLLAELTQRMEKSGAQVGRRDIAAPQNGVVMDLRHFTPGGVIAPGAEVMDIVPTEEQLVVEARVRPLDIDVVRAGLAANVRLVAFKQRTTPTLDGTVVRVSADALTDERTGEVYFQATVEVPPEELDRAPGVELRPGMPVEVAIVTGERTMVAYLLQPLTDSLARAFREQ